MFLKNLTLLFFFYCSTSSGYSKSSKVDSIQINSKTNGVIITIKLDTIPDIDNYSAWQAQSGWFYITLYEVSGDSAEIEKIQLPNDIIKFQIIDSKESLQLGLRLRKPIKNYYFESSPTENILVAYLHYSNDYIAELEPSKTTKMNKLKKGTPDGIKTWLNITGITITCSGIISDNNSPMNEITKTGLLILFTNYIFDKILTII